MSIQHTLGPDDSLLRILVINPNSTRSFTTEIYEYLKPLIASDVKLDFYTAPSSGPPSIDGVRDGIVSAAAVLHDFGLATRNLTSEQEYISRTYKAVIIACFSVHPLVPALKECLPAVPNKPPVIGIMEAGVNYALQLGQTFGIATTGVQWEPLLDEGVRAMGIASHRFIGTRGTGFGATSLHGDGPAEALTKASVELAERGAKVIVLGCAGMAPMKRALEDKIQQHTKTRVPVVDGVQAAVDFAVSFARAGLSEPA